MKICSIKPRIVIIAGPTGVGKSRVAVKLATQFGGDIVNSDSMQVYRYMDIGTAKPTRDERLGVEHHLIDVVNPDEDFNAAVFSELAAKKINQIIESGRKVFVVGGTGLYIKALTKGLFKGPGADLELRNQYRERLRDLGVAELYRELQEKDAEAARRIHPNDSVRIIRALEIFEKSGESISGKQDEHGFRERPYETLKIALNIDRGRLYDIINARCNEMFSKGLVREVEKLMEMGFHEDLKSMKSLGYKQVSSFLGGEYDLDTALDIMMRETRRYAKRQLTWFNADKEFDWFHPDDIANIGQRIEDFYSLQSASASC
jgi:tRNA dimethylallyltransferase